MIKFNYRKIVVVGAMVTSITINGFSQLLTRQDSANDGIMAKAGDTKFSAYGEAKVQYNMQTGTANADLTRNVIYLSHNFNDKISLFSAAEIDNAGVTGNQVSGSVALQQCLLKFKLDSNNYIVGGLFTPRIGILNENNLPTTFNGNDRPFTETLIIPTTWREIGIGFYGGCSKIPLYYSVGIVNGLNSQGFSMTQGIGGGLYQGQNAAASSIGITGSLLFYANNLRIQASGYYAGSAGLTKQHADSLQLTYGPFGTPVAMGEFDVQYISKGFTVKALATIVSIPQADSINRAYANNVPEQMEGAYVEVGVNLAYLMNKNTKRNFTVFGRYEYVNIDAMTPPDGIENGADQQKYIVAGITYMPVKGVVLKADYVMRQTGNYNTQLLTPFGAQQVTYYPSNGFLNIGIGYYFN